jgi:hypothetical protein
MIGPVAPRCARLCSGYPPVTGVVVSFPLTSERSDRALWRGRDLHVGLDIYVGPLSRHYAGKRMTPVRQLAGERRNGHSELVVAWRRELSLALGEPLSWNEGSAAPCFTERVYFEPYACLQVMAAAVDRGEDDLREDEVAEAPEDHPVWRAAVNSDSPQFPHLYTPALWVPLEFHPIITARDPSGQRGSIGSSVWLYRELCEISVRTNAGAKFGGEFGEAARFGLAVFLLQAKRSATHRLPMCLES